VALVLGAGVYPDGRLSSMLTDRVLTTVVLYQEGKVDKLLMSGDNSLATYNES
jgi:vancomycin permeability regulator SanA